jgi:uncharacterized tellurite resistance protein B-like protein
MDLLSRLLGREPAAEARARDAGHDLRVAACALLLEMAHIDGESSLEEQEAILAILRKRFGLNDEQVSELVDAAAEEWKRSVDLWPFARRINQDFSETEKERLIEMIWEVAFLDGRLDKYEDYLVHKLANLLRLSHGQLIEAKLKVTRRNGIRG